MKTISVRERAARALCRRAGNPENTKFEGKPMWMSYLDDADAVLEAIGSDAKKIATKAVDNWLPPLDFRYAALDSFNLDDLEVSVRELVETAIRQALGKVITQPLALMFKA